jgi:hypothetical protein
MESKGTHLPIFRSQVEESVSTAKAISNQANRGFLGPIHGENFGKWPKNHFMVQINGFFINYHLAFIYLAKYILYI